MEDESRDLKGRTAKGAVWMMLEQTCTQGLNFTLGIILAHLLSPTDYGVVALVLIFISIGQVLVSSGLGQALIQKKTVDDLDFTMVFYLSLAISAVLYAILFFAAPAVAAFFKNDQLCLILRILSFNLVFFAINSVQSAELYRAMRFDVSFWISLVTTLTSFVASVALALGGFGVWALVWSTSLAAFSGVVARWFLIRWKPRLAFDLSRLKPLYRFGWKMMLSSLVGMCLNNLYGVLIGRLYSPADLAFVNKGRNLPDLLKTNLSTVFTQSAFPALSRMQDERDRMREALRRLMSVNVFIIFPSTMLMFVIARDLVLLLYGRPWTPCVVYLQVLCVGAALASMEGLSGLSALARGKSGLVLKVSVVRTILSLAILFVFLPRGILDWSLASVAVYGPVSLALDVWMGRRMVGYRCRMVAADVLPTVLLFGAVCVPVWAVKLVLPGEALGEIFARLSVQVALAGALFLSGAVLFRLRAVREVSSFVSPKIESRFPAWGRVRAYLEAGSTSGSCIDTLRRNMV